MNERTYTLNGQTYTQAEVDKIRADWRYYHNRGDWDIAARLRDALRRMVTAAW